MVVVVFVVVSGVSVALTGSMVLLSMRASPATLNCTGGRAPPPLLKAVRLQRQVAVEKHY